MTFRRISSILKKTTLPGGVTLREVMEAHYIKNGLEWGKDVDLAFDALAEAIHDGEGPNE